MAKSGRKLQIIDFKSEEGEKPYEFEWSDDKATILDVKEFINQKDGLDDVTNIKIYWFFMLLQDDIKVKDLLDQEKADLELYVSLPQFGPIVSTRDTIVFSKKMNVFGKYSKKRCMQLRPGQKEVFKIPNRGKFAVVRNKIEDTKNSYVVRYYEVENNWSIEIDGDQVFQVLGKDEKKELPIVETKKETLTLETTEGKGGKFSTGVAVVSGLATVGRFIFDILESCV